MDYHAHAESIRTQFLETGKLLSAIGDSTRQRIIMVLAKSDCSGMRVGEIAAQTHLSRPAISHHLKILRDEEVIGFSSEGTKNFYFLKLEGKWQTLVRLINQIEQLRTGKETP